MMLPCIYSLTQTVTHTGGQEITRATDAIEATGEAGAFTLVASANITSHI
jgi:hypothetical protein